MFQKGTFMTLNLIKLTEIRERSIRHGAQKKFVLNEILINPLNISYMRDDEEHKRYIRSLRAWPAGLSEEIELTRIYFANNSETNSICILGDATSVALKFRI